MASMEELRVLFGSTCTRLEQLLLLLDRPQHRHLLPGSVLLSGPSGSGKDSLVRAMAALLHIPVVEVQSDLSTPPVLPPGGPHIVYLRSVEWAGGISTEDDLQAAQLLCIARMLTARVAGRLVLCTTGRPELLHTSIRTRFDEELQVEVPTRSRRPAVLAHYIRTLAPDDMDTSEALAEVAEVSGRCNGFLGCDLASMCAQAVRAATLRHLDHRGEGLRLGVADLDGARAAVVPSSLSHHVQVAIPRVRWADIGGLEAVKERVQESIVWPFLHAAAYARLGIEPVRGILLYGPPGTGKTLLAKAIATEANANFIATSISRLVHSVVGESERVLFDIFDRARQSAPCIVFFDEIDSIFGGRSEDSGEGCQQLITQLLLEMDDLASDSHILVIGATNNPASIDSSFLQSGRFEQLLLVPPPDLAARVAILERASHRLPVAPDADLSSLAADTEGFTGADLVQLFNAAARHALMRDRTAQRVGKEDIERARASAYPSVTPRMLEELEEWGGQGSSKKKAAAEVKPFKFTFSM